MLKRLPINSNTHLYAIQRNHIMKCICSFLRVIHIYLPLCYKSNASNDPYRDLFVSMEGRGMGKASKVSNCIYTSLHIHSSHLVQIIMDLSNGGSMY